MTLDEFVTSIVSSIDNFANEYRQGILERNYPPEFDNEEEWFEQLLAFLSFEED
jgi:hypothetical protein